MYRQTLLGFYKPSSRRLCMSGVEGFTKQLCDPLLVPDLMCTLGCKAFPHVPDCQETCLKTVKTVHDLREKICTTFSGSFQTSFNASTPNVGFFPDNTCSVGCALARSYNHWQGTTLISAGTGMIVHAWYTASKTRDFISKIKWPACLVVLGMTSVAISWII